MQQIFVANAMGKWWILREQVERWYWNELSGLQHSAFSIEREKSRVKQPLHGSMN
jgi:hypothetical protein